MSDQPGRVSSSVKLPDYRMAGACCCTEHGHDAYLRTHGDDVWIECWHCGAQESAPTREQA